MIVCAAVVVAHKDNSDNKITIPCLRHGWAYGLIHDFGFAPGVYKRVEEGFLTHDGKFLDRIDALEHARTCGQLSATVRQYKQDHFENELYSEDLY